MATAELVKPENAMTVRYNLDALATMEAIAEQCGMQQVVGRGRFERAFLLADGIRRLKQSITPDMLKDIMELQGTSLGFRTDKDREGGYKPEDVKECLIEAILRGASPVGNEFNIIAGRSYLTKEFFVRALREMPGLTDLVLQPGVPVNGQGGAFVPYIATWRFYGVPGRMEKVARSEGGKVVEDNRICVRVNAGMGADAILGKAERKMRAAIYAQLTGTTVSEGEADEVQPGGNGIRPGTTLSQSLAERLGHAEPPADSGTDSAGGATANQGSAQADDGSISHDLDIALQTLRKCTRMTEISEVSETYCASGSPLSESERGMFQQAIADRRAEIEATRGKK